MNHTFHFHEIARLPMPNDNVAIATRRLDAGTNISLDGQRFTLDYTILEGHRFAVQPIRVGEPLLSWGLPFGVAIRHEGHNMYWSQSLSQLLMTMEAAVPNEETRFSPLADRQLKTLHPCCC